MPVNGSTRDNIFYWNKMTGNNSSRDVFLLGKMWKSNVKNIFSYHFPRWPMGVKSNHVVLTFPACTITYHVSTKPGSERQHITEWMHIWQQCPVTILEDISTNKYDSDLRYIAPLCWLNGIDNETNPATFRSLERSPFVYGYVRLEDSYAPWWTEWCTK